MLSPQGHIEHAAGVVDDGERTWLLTEAAAAPALAAWLDRMRFMMRVEVADATAGWAALGEPVGREGLPDEPVAWLDPWPHVLPGGTRYGPAEEEHPGRDWCLRVVLVPRASLEAEVDRRCGGAPWSLAGTWALEALRVEAGRPRFGAEVDHRTIPHELDWLRTAVHLHKGCYRGQETVARVHFRGHVNRTLRGLMFEGNDAPGERTLMAGGKEVGTVRTTLALDDRVLALGTLRREVPDGAEVAAGTRTARVVPLPPWSPDLTPIEEMFSKVKQGLRRARARTRAGLYDALGETLRRVTPQDILGWFRHAGLCATPG